MFFGIVQDFKKDIDNIPLTSEFFIINMKDIPYLDQSGLYALEDSIFYLKQKNITTLVVNPNKQPLLLMKKTDIVPNLIAEENIFLTIDKAIDFAKK